MRGQTENAARMNRRHYSDGRTETRVSFDIDVTALTDDQRSQIMLRGLEALGRMVAEAEWWPKSDKKPTVEKK